MATKNPRRPKEFALIGDVEEFEEDLIEDLLELKPGAECVLHIDSGGGSVTGALAVVTLMRHRKLRATGIVLGECSSATLMIFATCQTRIVTPHSIFLFHPIRWQSDKNVVSSDALQWAKHFDTLEKDMDDLQVRLFGKGEEQIRKWTAASNYVTGTQLVDAGLAELFEL